MKYLSNLIPILLAFLMSLMILPMQAHAQQDVDGNRLNRDINIMESILSEMFRMKSTSNSEQARVVAAYTSRNSGVRGTYLPDYGLIFQIDRSSTQYLVINSEDETEGSMVFQYGENDSGDPEAVTRESITERIMEFLKNYGSTIGQLESDEHVMVIYGGAPGSTWSGFNLFTTSSGSRISSGNSGDRLPVISVSARMSDLADHRRGSLNDQQFQNRVSISETEPNDAGSKDMRVMANIFETAFEDNNEGFEVRGSVDYLLLDNFGALFFFDTGYGSSGVLRAPSAPRLRVGSDSNNSRIVAIEEMKKTLAEQQQEVEQKREEQRKNTLAALETFKTEIREYLVDYGRTLSSVESDQHVLLSITLNSSIDEIPDRIDVQVAKSVLERMDQGNLSREQAINQVSLREY
ncbi:MAG: hypothetical protein U5K31_07805 [Balneolaceae bacterium]|nr:hypothetical protein [Balneolaceae bacterium]